MSKATNTRIGWLVRMVGVCGLAAASLAQPKDRKPTPPPPPAPSGDPAPLSGPGVHARDVPGAAGQFGNSTEGLKRKMAERIPPRVMREAMGAIMGEDAPDDVRATPEQREKIMSIQKDFEQQVRDYVQEHRAEIEELRDKTPGGGPAAEMLRRLDGANAAGGGSERGARRGRGPEAPGDMMDGAPRGKGKPGPDMFDGKGNRAEIPEEVRAQARELMENMPQAEQAYAKVWEQLTPEQRAAVDERLNDFRDRQAKQREDAYVRQRVNKDGKTPEANRDAGSPPPGRRRAADGMRNMPKGPVGEGMKKPEAPARDGAMGERRERLMKLFARMSPEQQEQLLERIEARMREVGVAPDARGRMRPERGEAKPPPSMDEMNLPSAEEMDEPPMPKPLPH